MAKGKVGRPKKKSGPSPSDVLKTKTMDSILGVSELMVEEEVDIDKAATPEVKLTTDIVEGVLEWMKAMERSGQSVEIGTTSNLPILKSGCSASENVAPLEGSKSKVRITQADIAEEVNYWLPSIVGYVAGANPPLNVFEGFARRIWGRK